jgi:hypothetical protein
MFQGEATNGTTSSEIRKAILEQNHLKTVMNYKKMGCLCLCNKRISCI